MSMQAVDNGQAMLRSKSGIHLRLPPTGLNLTQSLSSAEMPERKRRNSFSHLLFNRQRSSSEQFTSASFAGIQRPGSAQRQPSKYRIIRLPFVGGNKEPSPEQALDDCFADIRLQLAEMAVESQVFRSRVQSLSRGVSDLSQACQQQEQQEQEQQQQQQQESVRSNQVSRSNTAYYPHRRARDQTLTSGVSLHYSANTLPLPPIERVQSQPSPLLNSWSCYPSSTSQSQSTEDSSSSFSQSSSSQLTTSAGSVCDHTGLAPPDINLLVVDDTDSSRYSSEGEEEHRDQDDEVFNL